MPARKPIIGVSIALTILSILLLGWFGLGRLGISANTGRTPELIEFDAGYRGLFVVQFHDPTCPALHTVNGYLEIRVGSDGRFCTSTPIEYGWATDKFVYIDSDGRRSPIPDATDYGNDHTLDGAVIWSLGTYGDQTWVREVGGVYTQFDEQRIDEISACDWNNVTCWPRLADRDA
jgi:uncharacterized protein DUF6843